MCKVKNNTTSIDPCLLEKDIKPFLEKMKELKDLKLENSVLELDLFNEDEKLEVYSFNLEHINIPEILQFFEAKEKDSTVELNKVEYIEYDGLGYYFNLA